MKYKVIRYFTDLQDNDYAYKAGDMFPRDGIKVSAKRIEELSTPNNRRGEPMIVEVKAEAKEEKPAAKKSSGRKKSNAK